jgi:PadR family transcriptional regulator, regulatory protein AphA
MQGEIIMTLQNAILGLLIYSPKSGYDLKILFDKSVNHFWPANLSQIYRELGVLEKKGYVSSTVKTQKDRPDKRIYTITADGEKAFLAWLNDFPDVLLSPKRDEFMVRIFFGANIGDQELKKQLERFRKERENSKQSINAVIDHFKTRIRDSLKKKSMSRNLKFWLMTVRRAQLTNTALIEWAEECMADLEKGL